MAGLKRSSMRNKWEFMGRQRQWKTIIKRRTLEKTCKEWSLKHLFIVTRRHGQNKKSNPGVIADTLMNILMRRKTKSAWLEIWGFCDHWEPQNTATILTWRDTGHWTLDCDVLFYGIWHYHYHHHHHNYPGGDVDRGGQTGNPAHHSTQDLSRWHRSLHRGRIIIDQRSYLSLATLAVIV